MAWWQHSEKIIQDIISSLQIHCTSGSWQYDCVKYSVHGAIAEVKLDDLNTYNALTRKTVAALLDICAELHGRPDVAAVVFTAAGPHFCSGGAFGGNVPEDDEEYAPKLEPGASAFEVGVAENLPIARLLYLLSTLPQYKVAALRGKSLGAGISLAAAMDFVVAPERLRLRSASAEGLLQALAEVHRSPQVRLLQVVCDGPSIGGCSKTLRRALALLHFCPAFTLALVSGQTSALPMLCDAALCTPEASFDFSAEYMEYLPTELQAGRLNAKEAEELGLVEIAEHHQFLTDICRKLSECAPNAVAQSKAFIHKICSKPMEPRILEELAGHIARRMEDPEFQDSLRAVVDEAHLPVYKRPGNKVVPAHLMREEDRTPHSLPAN
ncbi:unnamed protein product [Effrenium voratum]|nr:unnamed protein product [Effrenium voratum]